MAKILFGTGIASGASGRMAADVGGIVFQKNGRARTYTTPVNPQTSDQVSVRNAFTYLNGQWGLLTEAQRASWEAARTSGQWDIPDSLTGVPRPAVNAKALFIECNMLSTVGIGLPVSVVQPGAPTAIGFENMEVTGITATTSAMSVTFTGPTDESAIVVFATPPLSPGTLVKRKSQLRSIYQQLVPTSPSNIFAAYEAKFGALAGAAGSAVFIDVWQYQPSGCKRRLLASERIILT